MLGLSVLAPADNVVAGGHPRDSFADLVEHARRVESEVSRPGHGLAAGHRSAEQLPVERVYAGGTHRDPDLPRPRVRRWSIFPAQSLRTPVFGVLQRSHEILPLRLTGRKTARSGPVTRLYGSR